ncbi:hypothetical protein AB9P05_11975 [Roseivirga sp. BDSF3-8]|uniref:hypothetical protein n=1 Tax=Roseivirga sp. BDSF3-8 TaxID=3241598 RepID=UPI003531AF19
MKNNFSKPFLLALGLIMALMISFQTLCHGQSPGAIYGTIETIDGNSYTGALRWGKEEAFWSDMFNSQKTRNTNVKYLSKSDYEKMKGEKEEGWKWNNYSISFIWDDEYHATTHSFACRFGDIARIELKGREEINLVLKNGEEIELEGGSNDIGADIQVRDREIGEISIPWNRIEVISFSETPDNLRAHFGEALIGTVKTERGEYTGRIQWDHDECVGEDKLDGDTRDGDVSIKFNNIAAIKKDGRGSEVTLRSGRTMYLYGSNDVNSGNRGVVINLPDLGKVKVGWDDFVSLELIWGRNSDMMGYKDFPKPEKISGTVRTTNGQTLRGELIYDLDETWDLEMLDGSDEDTEYSIPFRNIKRIKPKNYAYTEIILKNGQKLLLGDSQDVTDKHDGVLVFTSRDSSPKYVVWDDIDEILID